MVEVVSHDSSFPPAPRHDHAVAGFWIEAGGTTRAACHEVRGFGEALVAARDPLAPAPLRLVIAGLDDQARAWLARWAEDAEQVRRTVVLRRAADGAQVAIIATLASHGFGVPTSLCVESVRSREGGDILRSGVHLKVDVQAVLAGCDMDREHDGAAASPEPG
jgi:hypothetical protein